MTSLADVKRESQGDRPIYFNDEDKGISLGVLFFGLGEILDAAEGVSELIETLYNQYNIPAEYSGRLLLAKLGLEHIIKIQGEIYPVTDQHQRRLRVEHHDYGPMTIIFEERGAA